MRRTFPSSRTDPELYPGLRILLTYMIRHGQTAWNAEGRLQGQKDIPLNDTGRAQAAGNGRALKAILRDTVSDFDFVASPLGRTRETMELLRGAMGLDPSAYRTDPRLVEVSFGDWEGHTLPELTALDAGPRRGARALQMELHPAGRRR